MREPDFGTCRPTTVKASELIYDWNKIHPASLKPMGVVLLNDESLRDGLQSPSVRDPSIEEKIEILHLMEALGINSLDLGLPGAGPRAVEHVTALACEMVNHRMKIRANCAARTRTTFVQLRKSSKKLAFRLKLPPSSALVQFGAIPRGGRRIFFCRRRKK